MCCLLTGVPRVVAVRPRQLRLEAVGQVEHSPGQDDDVIHAAMQDHHLTGVAKACTDTHSGRTSHCYLMNNNTIEPDTQGGLNKYKHTHTHNLSIISSKTLEFK